MGIVLWQPLHNCHGSPFQRVLKISMNVLKFFVGICIHYFALINPFSIFATEKLFLSVAIEPGVAPVTSGFEAVTLGPLDIQPLERFKVLYSCFGRKLDHMTHIIP